MTTSVDRLAELVTGESGIRFQASQHAGLVAALGRAMPDTAPERFLELARDPLARQHALATLIDEVTIKETSFLRDRDQLDSIDWHELHDRARAAGRNTIRVWSAACSTGEEPYSLALLASEAFGAAEPPVRILATDISGAALAAAAKGAYRERSLRALPEGLRERYFESSHDHLVASARLRRHVVFARHNLVRDPFPPRGETSFDLIVCRNVLIYFSPATIETLLDDLTTALEPAGRLMIGAADALSGVTRSLARLSRPDSSDRIPLADSARALRRPLGRAHERSFDDRVADALRAADEGRSEAALSLATQLVEERPLQAELHYVRGLVELESGGPTAAVSSFRRALYLDPDFGLAAFTLGRAHEARGDTTAARRSYHQALLSLDSSNERHDEILGQVDLADVAAACETRLSALRTVTRP